MERVDGLGNVPTEVAEVFKDAPLQLGKFRSVDVARLEAVTSRALTLVGQLEKVARRPNIPLLPDEAGKIKALWVLSGPGYFDEPFKDDRYKKKPWARWMDRRRVGYALGLIRRLGHPFLIYNGRDDENARVLTGLGRMGVPQERVHIISAGIDNTLDQVRSFRLPEGVLLRPGDVIGIVSHAPHLARVMYMLAHYNEVVPPGVMVRLFPLPTPESGREEYARMEVRGILHHVFISHDAEEEPHPHTL